MNNDKDPYAAIFGLLLTVVIVAFIGILLFLVQMGFSA